MTKIKLLLLAIVASMAFTISTSSQTPPKATAADSGYVFVYAPRIAWHFGNVNDSIFVDNTEIAKLGTESFFGIALEPGKHTLTVKRKNQGGVILDVKSGEKYFLRLERQVGTWIRATGLTVVPSENAAFDLPTLKIMDKNSLLDPRATSDKSELP